MCPKCMVHTPVGVRCRDCAGLKRLPTFDVSHGDIVKASLTGIGIGVALGLLFGFLSFILFSIPFLPWIALVGIGYGVGEGVSLWVNRKRGRALQAIAAVCVFVSFIFFSVFGQFLVRDLFGLLALAFAVYVAVTRVRP